MILELPPHAAKNLSHFADTRKKALSPLYGEVHVLFLERTAHLYTCHSGRHLARLVVAADLPDEVQNTTGIGHADNLTSPGGFEVGLAAELEPSFDKLWDYWARRHDKPTIIYRVENTEDMALFAKIRSEITGKPTQVSFRPVTGNVSHWQGGGLTGFTTHNTMIPWLERFQ